MAYGSAKGRIFRGDIYAEDDPNQDTYIDWGNDFISFGVGGVKVLNVSASNTLVQVLGHVSASGNFTGSNFHAHGIISASSNITASGHVSASAFYGDGQYLKNVGGGGGSGGGIFTTLGSGNAYTTSSIRVGSVGEPSASLHVSGTGAGAGPVFRLDSSVAGGTPLFFVSGSGRVGIGTATPGIGGSSDTKLDVQGHLTIGKAGTAYIFNNNDADTYIKLGGSVPPGIDGMQFFVGGKRMLMLDENGTDRVVIGNSSSDFTVVSGSLIVSGNLEACAGTASIAHLSGCSPITVHSPISSSQNLTASNLFVPSGNSIFFDAAKTYKITNNGTNLDINGDNIILNANTKVSASAPLTASGFYGSRAQLSSSNADGKELFFGSGTSRKIGTSVTGSDDYLVMANTAGGIDVSASEGVTLIAGKNTNVTAYSAGNYKFQLADATFATVFYADNNGNVSASANITASGHVSASAFFGRNAYVSSLTSSGIVFANVNGNGQLTSSIDFRYNDDGLGAGSFLQVRTKGPAGNNFTGIVAKTASISVLNAAETGLLAYLGHDGSISASANISGSGLYISKARLTEGGASFGKNQKPKIALEVHYTGSKAPSVLPDNTGAGEVVYFGTSSASGLQTGALYYLNAKGGWASASAAQTGSSPTSGGGQSQLLAISLGSNPSSDGMLTRGFVDAETYFVGAYKTGSAVYVSTGSAKFKSVAPTASNNYVRVIGYATTTPKVIYFNPDSTYVEIA